MDNRGTDSTGINQIIGRLCDLNGAERSTLLDEVAEGDPALRAQIEQLLGNYDSALKFFEQFPDLLQAITTDQVPSQTFSEGDLVASRFRIRRLLGHGGVGEVYEAEDLELRGEPVALKTVRAIRASDQVLMDQLRRELQLARKISHPNVCRVYDVYPHPTRSGTRIPVFTMELLEGETLTARLQRGPIAADDALALVKQIAEAIDAAHAANVAHGDLKPGNIMLVSTPHGGDRVVVTDFGFARWLPVGSTLVSSTTETRRWGTPLYMAPEQLLGGRITRASDIYALGVVCYEMITGQHPFTLDAPLLLAVNKLRRAPRPPCELVPSLDPRWQAAILRCLDINPDRRFRHATDVVRAIERTPRRQPWAIAAAALIGAIAVAWTATALIDQPAQSTTGIVRSVNAERIVAVLPFSHESAAPDGDTFALGLTAALIDRLGSVSNHERGLYVIPTEEVINTGVNTPALAQHTLGASLFIGGRLSVANGRTDVTVGLNELSDQGVRLKTSRRVSIATANASVLDAVAQAVMQLLEMDGAAPPVRSGGGDATEAERLYLLGRGYLAHGQRGLAMAIDALQRATRLRNGFALAQAGLSDAYRMQYLATRDAKYLQLAQESIDRAVTSDPRNARARVIRGRLYVMSSQYPRAILELKTALGLDPDVPDGRRLLAAAYQGDGAVAEAEAMYREAVTRHPRHWSAHVVLGNFLYRQGRYREAEQSLVNGVTLAPANRDAILNLSAVYLAQEQFAAAEAELRRATDLSPDADLYNNLAWVYILEGKSSDAVAAMEAAVKLAGADSLVWSSLARAYRWAGRENDARPAYEKALARADEERYVSPLDAEVRGNRAYLLAESGRTDEALREIGDSLALESAKTNVIVYFNSALIHEWAGDRKRALRDLRAAAQGGYSKAVIERHPDLTRLRQDPAYPRTWEMTGKKAS
ncbi:MAG TPA: protein kinase [Vicinamibacterales bacterium]|nr:protein kinase [Vicinamibacterales bacterium]